MTWPNLNNAYLQGTPSNGMSSMGVTPQSLNFTGVDSSQIPIGQFGNQIDQASSWLKNLPSVGSAGGLGFGFNIPTAQLGLGALNTAAGLWGGLQAQKLARDQFNFTKNMATTNLANQTQSYNTALTDKINARAKTQGMTSQETQAYLDKNRLPAA